MDATELFSLLLNRQMDEVPLSETTDSFSELIKTDELIEMRDSPVLEEGNFLLDLFNARGAFTSKKAQHINQAMTIMMENGHSPNRPVEGGFNCLMEAHLLGGQNYELSIRILRVLIPETDYTLTNDRKQTPLHHLFGSGLRASRTGMETVLGLKPYFGPLLPCQDINGNTPLHLLANKASRRKGNFLLEMEKASFNMHVERLLIMAARYGVSPHQTNNDGMSIIDAVAIGVDDGLAAKISRNTISASGIVKRRNKTI